MKIYLFLISLLASNAFAWESYEFEVSYIRAAGDNCYIGMKNLSDKKNEDSAVCDNPTEIVFTDCLTDASKMKMSLALAAKMANKRMYHQAIAQYSDSPCKVKPYNLGIAP